MRPPMRPCTVLLFSLLTACAPALAEAPSWAEALEAILPATDRLLSGAKVAMPTLPWITMPLVGAV